MYNTSPEVIQTIYPINPTPSMPSISKKQRRFMGMVDAAKDGKKGFSPAVMKAAKSMTKKQVDDFAKTKEKGLPMKAKKKKAKKGFKQVMRGSSLATL